MEVNQELRFVCKLCNKRYQCGKSLGGHMRSHVIANSAESKEKVQTSKKKMLFLNAGGKNFVKESRVVELGHGQSSYGLRENPKKTWRASDSPIPLPQEKICKQCGKGFQSMKALCGHVACHSEKERGLKDDHSWTSDNPKMVMDSYSDAETEDCRLRTTRSSNGKRYKSVTVKTSSFSLANGHSFVSEINEQGQEEIAICLMMLSRDTGNNGGVNSVVESSDNSSVVLEAKSSSIDMKISRKAGLDYVQNIDVIPHTQKISDEKLKASAFLDAETAQMEKSDSGYCLHECTTKADSDASVDGFYKNGTSTDNLYWIKGYKTELRKKLTKENGYDMTSNSARIGSRKREYISDGPQLDECSRRMDSSGVGSNAWTRSKYECLNCKKSFNSYQTLGGHRPYHKRRNDNLESKYETDENSLDGNSQTVGKLGESVSNIKRIARNSSNDAEKKVKPKKNTVHVCPFCNKVYKNGQALGGHKRSHFLGGHLKINNQTRVIKPQLPDLLDLNLPAPENDDDETQPILDMESW